MVRQWDEEGYNYHLDYSDTYLVRYYPVLTPRRSRDMAGRKTVTATHGRYTVDSSAGEGHQIDGDATNRP